MKQIRRSKRNNKLSLQSNRLLTSVAIKDIRYITPLWNYTTNGTYSLQAGANDIRNITISGMITSELANLANVYKYYKILHIHVRVSRIFPESYNQTLGNMYLNLDLSNTGSNPNNAQLLETISCLRVCPFKLTPTSKTWVAGSFANLTNNPVFNIWFPTSSTPNYGSLVIGQDVANTSGTNDKLFVLEVTVRVQLSDSN